MLILFFPLFISGIAHGRGGPARAQWLNSQQLLLKLPQGLRATDSTNFVLATGDISLQKNPNKITLPLLEIRNNYALLSSAGVDRATIQELLHHPLKVFVTDNTNQVLDSTAIQYAGLLDEIYAYQGEDLGLTVQGSQMQLKLWAPTALAVRLFLYSSSASDAHQPSQILPMNWQDGVWAATLSQQYQNSFYLYEVTVYQPLTDQIETSLVTDPYSFSLSMNGTMSQLIDVQASDLKPSGWDNLQKPHLNSFKDIVIYELHIRDFSASDETIPFPYRGTYDAFSFPQSNSNRHLRSLGQAGLTHVHLLPFNDFGSVNENKSTWQTVNSGNGNLQDPQDALSRVRATDGFNWGYDPVHFLVPEGSYSIKPDGVSRVREVRDMVQSLNTMGLRVIQDVVFNHTFASGLDRLSVFDKIVPLYYYRLNDEGTTYNTSCCSDTASEHRMMEKLMIDTVRHWARTYKIDGFRFDLMSFHSRDTILKIKDAVRSLTVSDDGVDGSKIYLYGEGWPFGSFYDRNPKAAMTQVNSYGAGVGLFNDRLRDAVRGGTTNSSEKSDQGYATGLYFDFNKEPANRNTPTNLNDQRDKLLHLGDVIKVGLAGNLRDFTFREHLGSVIRGGDLLYRSSQVATSAQPIETINYVSAHDGYTLWDSVQAKAPFYTEGRSPALASVENRQRMHQLAMAIPLLSQGIPFIEAGTEILRSKNGDQDSYDSGDFFNRLDWSGATNHWGEGLPPAWKNYDDWSFWQPRLQTPALQASASLIAQTNNYFKALLRVRQSTSLFKMNSLDEIMSRLTFIDNENRSEPGLIAMILHNDQEALLIFFNSSRDSRIFSDKVMSYAWEIHPLFDSKVDSALSQVVLLPKQSQVQIPGLSTVVLRMSLGNKARLHFRGVR
ncbi:alpha-1,6-glucosidase domain-containing protein [Bdellovibrio svalbardensis]|uniref:DUF3372 domain-containing protein n=1 Tax=Bdellovibrio svalbardensis TaxID=2972972 RepID=A0ABT6DK26_9BACT|nr:alpha-1,6-glucosidase domain-containing protein [Bdellovibrio svalbardensis]MDG0817225.1 DUF3372 domain-containing protein [Bdellovibrio svalbardensis]